MLFFLIKILFLLALFLITVRNMLGNATSQDAMNFRTVIEGRNNNHVDQSRDFKVLQTPQPVPAKSQKRWNIGKINTYIIYTAYTYSCVCAHLVNIGMEQKTELGSMQNFTLLKTNIWWFSEDFFFFFLRQTQLQPIFMHFETDVHGVEIRLRCYFLSMQAVISCFSREPEKYVTCLGQ